MTCLSDVNLISYETCRDIPIRRDIRASLIPHGVTTIISDQITLLLMELTAPAC